MTSPFVTKNEHLGRGSRLSERSGRSSGVAAD
jgi:hypothetical protein